MGGEIIAEKFALLKTKGSNGVAFTHIVEDTLLGERAVVKVSDKFGFLALEYLKAMSMVREMEIPGILVPFEGGILEEETGYYLAFPEMGEPSLENYLRMGILLAASEALGLVEQVLSILEGLHRAGFSHLFIDTRNVFFRARGRVTLKDPALEAEFFHPLLEAVASPDFSYFSPQVMDGAMPGPEADLYAVGRLAERLLEEVVDADTSPEARALRWVAEECRRGGMVGKAEEIGEIEEIGEAGERLTAGAIREALRNGAAGIEEEALGSGAAGVMGEAPGSVAAAVEEGAATPVTGDAAWDGWGSGATQIGGPGKRSGVKRVRLGRGRKTDRKRARGKERLGAGKRRVGILAVLGTMTVLVLSLAPALSLRGETGRGPAANAAGGSEAGKEVVVTRLAVSGGPASEGAAAAADDGGKAAETPPEQAASPVTGVGDGAEEPRTGEDAAPAQPSQPVAPEAPAERSPSPPVASFSLSPSQGQSPLQVYLDASSSYDPDGSIVSYSWSFGGRGRALYYVFESGVIPATVTVTLTVTDDGGHSSQATRGVTLY